MKNIEPYLECQKIADEILDAINDKEKKDAHEELLKSLSKFKQTDKFKKNITSETYLEDTMNLLDTAYENRDTDKLMGRLSNSDKLRKWKIRSLFVGSASVAAALVMVSMYILNGSTEEIKLAQVTDENRSVPVLIVDNKEIRLDTKIEKLNARDYAKQNQSVASNNQTLIVPNGFTYRVILPDSTEVILNADSKLIYPSEFTTNDRGVTLEGEAFFNVTKSDVPFVVTVNNAYVKVYGTSFNVRSREKDKVSIVLVSGSIGAGTEAMSEVRVAPNQLLDIEVKTGAYSLTTVDAANYLSWKDGMFKYNEVSFNDFITEVSLWYNVKFNYDRKMFDAVKFNISTNRNTTIYDMLQVIEKIAEVKFIKEKTNEYIIVEK